MTYENRTDHVCLLCKEDSETLLHILDKCAATMAADETV